MNKFRESISTDTWIYVYMFIYMSIYMFTCFYIYVYIYKHIHLYLYTSNNTKAFVSCFCNHHRNDVKTFIFEFLMLDFILY